VYFGGKIVSFADEVDIRGRIIGLNLLHEVSNFDFLAHSQGYLFIAFIAAMA
jgi:hypothetical protein